MPLLIISIVATQNTNNWPNNITVGLIRSYLQPILYELVLNESVKDLKSAELVPDYVNFK